MKSTILFLLFSALCSPFCRSAMADDCFIYRINRKTIANGVCSKRYPPQSTFKIAISLMGYNEDILIDETQPQVPFTPGDADDVEAWKQPHNPTLWMKNSCVWYSRFVTKKLEMNKLKEYVKNFNYGNQDVSGDIGKNNGLTNSWISSSLRISPSEQVAFLENFLQLKLPVKKKAQSFTHNILYIEDLPNGWKFYGKTGTGDLLKDDGSHDTTSERGWFVGWIERAERHIPFAQYIEVKNEKTAENHFGYVASKQAKALAKEKMLKVIMAVRARH